MRGNRVGPKREILHEGLGLLKLSPRTRNFPWATA